MSKSKPTIRRFVHPDGRWLNISAAKGHLVQFSGNKESTVPYFGDVIEENIKPPAGRALDEEIEKLVADLIVRQYVEVLPTQKLADETKIDGLWRQFENWLCEYTPVYCRWPLEPGVTEQELLSFERTIGAELPFDIRRSYLRHNGSAGVRLLSVVGEGRWVTLSKAAKQWEFFQEIRPALEDAGYLEKPLGPMKEVHISPKWIPISDNSGGDHLCVDLDPAEGGTVGQLFSYWHEYGAWRLVATSMTDFLQRLLKHLAKGKYAINAEGQLAPVNGPEPESVEEVQEYFLKG